MKHFSFGTFLVDDSNREAFRICKAVADLHPVSPQPVLLLGDEGCGKTHLLYAIVNCVRAGSAKTGLAYVTAHDPSQVRALIDDPSPVVRARSAILLVDRLEQFANLVEELEGVVRIFLENGHYVVFASSVHPGRLQNLTAGLRAILDAGQIVRVEPSPGENQIELLKRKVRQELEDQLSSQRREIEELRAQLTRARAGTGQDRPDEAALRADALHAETEAALADAAQARMLLRTERAEKENLAKQLEQASVELDAARKESAQARNEANQLVRRAQDLLDQIERNRARLAHPEESRWETARELDSSLEEQQERVRALTDAQEQVAAATEQAAAAQQQAAEAKGLLASLHEEFEAQRLQFEEALARAGSELGAERDRLAALLEQTRTERDRLQEALDEARSDGDALQARLDSLQKTYETQNQEMESLRHEAAGQVAEAQAQAGEIEGRLNRFRGAYRDLRQTNRNVAGALENLDGQLAATAETLAQLAERLKASEGDLDEERVPGESPPARVVAPHEAPAPRPAADETSGIPPEDEGAVPDETSGEAPELQPSSAASSGTSSVAAERDVSI